MTAGEAGAALESQTVRNGSESPVPNGSGFRLGRPAVLSDIDLQNLAATLNQRLGRPPRADELITEAGGCQRKRALAAIRSLKLDLAQLAVQSQLVLPPAVERDIRALMARWLEHAGQQLAARHLEDQERLEQSQTAQRALIEEQQEKISLLSQQLADRERIAAELSTRLRRLEQTLADARSQLVRTEAMADERLRLLAQLQPQKASSE